MSPFFLVFNTKEEQILFHYYINVMLFIHVVQMRFFLKFPVYFELLLSFGLYYFANFVTNSIKPIFHCLRTTLAFN